MGRRELTSDDVRDLVFKAIGMIMDAQRKLNLPICPHMEETHERLRSGGFRAEPLSRNGGGLYAMDYGAFEPPSTIVLDSGLPSCDEHLDIPQLPNTLASYCATHEVIHADDHTGGDRVLSATRSHILLDHVDKLEKGMQIIERKGGRDCIGGYEELAGLWASQYVDMVTHYRSYVVLRHKQLPKIDLVWARLGDHFFPPNLLTCIERQRGINHVFDIITKRVGEYCLIDALGESQRIRERNEFRYTV